MGRHCGQPRSEPIRETLLAVVILQADPITQADLATVIVEIGRAHV